MNASDNNGSKTIADLGIAERLRSKLFVLIKRRDFLGKEEEGKLDEDQSKK